MTICPIHPNHLHRQTIFQLTILCCILPFALCQNLLAAPAVPHELTFEQPDGKTFKGHLRGDEHFNWIEMSGGYIIVKNPKTGFYEFAAIEEIQGHEELMSTGIIVDEEGKNRKEIPPICRSTLSRLAIKARLEIEKAKAPVYNGPIAGHKIAPIKESDMEMEDHHIERE